MHLSNNNISTVTETAIDQPNTLTPTSPAIKFTNLVNLDNSFNSCLSLDGNSAESICDYSQGVPRLDQLRIYHLKHCHRYPLAIVLSKQAWLNVVHSNSSVCYNVLSELLVLDNRVNQLICDYDSLLSRYDCDTGFSVKWDCDECRVRLITNIIHFYGTLVIAIFIFIFIASSFYEHSH
jgi:hypothetical protein